MNATSQLPNPFTPLAFLPPAISEILTNQVYATIGSLAALIWDIGLHIPEDYEMLTCYRIDVSVIVYFISRVMSLTYLLVLAVVQTNPVGDCALVRNIQVIYPFTAPATVLLFVFRVSALYNHNKHVTTFFFLLWLGVFGCSILVPISTSATNIGFTKYCVQDELKPYVKFSIILPPVNDTLVFLATSWAFFTNVYMETNVKNGFDVMVLGKHLPAFSRSILQNGQAYYLVSLVFTLIFTISYFGHSSTRIWSFMFTLPCFVVLNNMSCHIYRNIRLGHYDKSTTWTSIIDRVPELGHQQIPAVANKHIELRESTRRIRETTDV